MFILGHLHKWARGVNDKPQPSVDLRKDCLLPTKRGSQSQENPQQCRCKPWCVGHSENPTEIIHKDKSPVHLREQCIEDPKEQGSHPAPVQLSTGYAISANFVDPPLLVNLCDLVFPTWSENFYSPMGLGNICFQQQESRVFIGPVPHAPFCHGVNAIGSRPLLLWGTFCGWNLSGRSQPMNAMNTVHHCGCCCFLCAVLLDMGICPTKTTIINGTNLVSFINGRHRPRTEFTRIASTSVRCFLLGERAFHQAHGFFFNECFFDGVWEGFSWIIVMATCRWGEIFPIVWTSPEFFLRGPHSGRCQSRFIHPNWNPFLECEWVFPVWVSRCLRQPWDQGKEKGLPFGNAIFWCGSKTLSNVPECDIGERMVLLPTGDRHLDCLVEFWCDVNDLTSQGCDPRVFP